MICTAACGRAASTSVSDRTRIFRTSFIHDPRLQSSPTSEDRTFSSIGRNNADQYPTLEEMFLETSRSGKLENYLASEEQFQWLKKFEAENRLIPIVGDFAGTHALRAVAAFLKANGLRVSTFYTSNVEFYLFGAAGWERFVANVHALPLTDDAVFIRSYFPTYGRRHPLNVPGHRSTSLVQPIGRFLEDYDAHR